MLTVSTLTKPLLDRAIVNHTTYKLIYNQCAEHIKRKNTADCTTTLFNVPEFMIGRPTFTHAHAVRYVSEKLRKGGFNVQVEGALLIISWKNSVKEESAKQAQVKAKAKKRQKDNDKSSSSSSHIEPLSLRLERLNNAVTKLNLSKPKRVAFKS